MKEIIYSAKGVPIGNYLSQFFANLYLTYFDHWVKEELKCKYYFRYADDIVILGNDNHFRVHFMYNNKPYYFKSKNRRLHYSLLRYKFPINFKITPYVRAE